MAKTVVGLFDNYAAAHAAVTDLERGGIARGDISMMANEATRDEAHGTRGGTADDPRKTVGVGAATGAGIGLLVGLSALAIPGLGPIVVAGPIAGLLAGAGVGAAAGGVVAALKSAGVPESMAHAYAEGVRRGGTLVTVRADDEQAARVRDILNEHGAIDVTQRAAAWRQDDHTGRDAGAVSSAPAETAREFPTLRATPPPPAATPAVAKPGPIAAANRSGDRRPRFAEQPMSGAEWDSYSERVIEVDEPVHVPSLRIVDPEVRGAGGAGTAADANPREFGTYDAEFRRNFGLAYPNSGGTYEDYVPAYHYGYVLALDPRYGTREWSVIEPDVRNAWEHRNPGTWDRASHAIHHAWDRVRGRLARA
jgi:hypothetical protein